MKIDLNKLDFLKKVLLILIFNSTIYSQTIHFEFANPQITGSLPNLYYEFDILASASEPTQFKIAQLYLAYNIAAFGNNIVQNNKVTLAGGSLLNNVDGNNDDIGHYSLNCNDNTNSIIAVQNYWMKIGTASTDQGYELTNTLGVIPVIYMHIRIQIYDQNSAVGISFINNVISQGNEQDYYFTTPLSDSKSVYENVTYGTSLNSALPVELNSFTARKSDGGILLSWSTESETHNYGFEVEFSQITLKDTTLKNFQKLAFVNGYGNSNVPRQYSYLFQGVKYGNYAFRLKQIDIDGTYKYGSTIKVNAGEIPNGFVLEQNYPNPFNPETKIRFASSKNEVAKLIIYDVLGNEVARLLDEQLEADKVYEIKFKATNLSSGVYYYRLFTDSKSIVKKMILLK